MASIGASLADVGRSGRRYGAIRAGSLAGVVCSEVVNSGDSIVVDDGAGYALVRGRAGAREAGRVTNIANR